MSFEYITNSASETEACGASLARRLCGNGNDRIFVCLYGDLGAGKTAFVRGFASVLSPTSRVKSPTFTVVNEYLGGSVPLYHFDLYRLEDDADALYGIGFDDYVAGGHCIVEWSEFLPEIPAGAVKVTIEKLGGEKRKITVDD